MVMEKIEPYKGIAGIYEEVRPSYPEKLIQDIITKTNLKLNNNLLEIGAGTGKATIQFANKGFKIHAIELGEEMAAILKDKCANYPNILVDVTSFEEWNCPDNERYDMIYSAQAFHWLDKNLKYKKCYEILKDKGYLVLFWYKPCDNKLPKTRELQEKIDRIVKKYASYYPADDGKPQRRKHDGVYEDDGRKAEIESSGLFRLVERVEYISETRNNADQYLKVIKSVPAFASILDGLDDTTIDNMDSEIKEVINEYGGYVGALFNFSLYITKKYNNL